MTHLAKQTPVAKRMRDLREALGHDRKTDFARLLGITLARWSRIEQGCPITIKMATRMREKIPGLTTDYILDGDTAGLSENLRLLLRVPESTKTFPPLPLGPAFGRMKGND